MDWANTKLVNINSNITIFDDIEAQITKLYANWANRTKPSKSCLEFARMSGGVVDNLTLLL